MVVSRGRGIKAEGTYRLVALWGPSDRHVGCWEEA